MRTGEARVDPGLGPPPHSGSMQLRTRLPATFHTRSVAPPCCDCEPSSCCHTVEPANVTLLR